MSCLRLDNPVPRRMATVLATISIWFSASVTLADNFRAPPAPNINARSYFMLDFQSGKVLAEKNADEQVEPASITKIMTVYVAGNALREGHIRLDDEVTVSEKAWRTEGSRMFIEVGKQVTVDALLDGIIVQSGNDASVALAEHISGSEASFAVVMNDYAHTLGMKHSSFANATGLPDPGTYVTARDVTRLSAALIREFPELYSRFSKKEFTYNEIRQPNRNRLLYRDEGVDGIKTGHTEAAGYCLVSSASRNGMRLVATVMGTESDRARTESSSALLRHGFRFFESRRLYAAGTTVLDAKIWRGSSESITVGVIEHADIVFPRGRYDKLQATATVNDPLMAPLTRGDVVGSVQVRLKGELISEFNLHALEDAAEGSFFSRTLDDLMMMFE